MNYSVLSQRLQISHPETDSTAKPVNEYKRKGFVSRSLCARYLLRMSTDRPNLTLTSSDWNKATFYKVLNT